MSLPTRRDLLAAGAATVVAAHAPFARQERSGAPQSLQAGAQRPVRLTPNLTIRDYLTLEARRITEGALADLKAAGPAGFERAVAARRRRYMEMMGLADLPPAGRRDPVPVKITGVLERDGYRIEKLHYESLPNLHVTANFYVPTGGSAGVRRPGILYVCGHAADQKFHYQVHPRRLAQLGFPTLIVETVQLGEVTGYHHGCYREGWFHWYSRGYSPAAIELLNGVRALDLLAARPEVDPDRLGLTGISGGGAVTWWIAAADERVKSCSPVCGTATLASHVYDRVIDGHCDCMWWINSAGWDLADIGALIAPRPLLIASADQDGIFPIHAIREVHGQLRGLYEMLDRSEQLRLVETPGGHSYHERSRTAIFSWFLKHLTGRDVAPEQVGDIETDTSRLEPSAALKVFVSGEPAGNRVRSIHDDLIPPATPPSISSAADVSRARASLIEKLRGDTFAMFPRNPPPLDVEEEFALDDGQGTRFAFTSESGWRLHGTRRVPRDAPSGSLPAVVMLRSPGEARNDSENFAGAIRLPWTRAIVETRGTGDTSWGEDLNWHVRRASAWTGRTIASMRVWDALRALEAVRTLPGIDAKQIALAAQGEMCAVALYAALLDGNVRTLILSAPPATQNTSSSPDGRGPAVEMLNCLRYTDLPYVAGLLHPVRLVLVGSRPDAYAWTEQMYGRLGTRDGLLRLDKVADLTA